MLDVLDIGQSELGAGRRTTRGGEQYHAATYDELMWESKYADALIYLQGFKWGKQYDTIPSRRLCTTIRSIYEITKPTSPQTHCSMNS